MFDILYPLNLFPYTQLWRIGREPEHNNRCSILASVFIILIIGALLINMLIAVFQMNTITSKAQTTVSQSPPLTQISTFQHDDNKRPFMFALDYTFPNPGLNTTSLPFNVSAYTQTITISANSSRNTSWNSIPLQPCTSEHFSRIPSIKKKFTSWRAHNWLCLPINRTFTIQGSYTLTGIYESFNVLLSCEGVCAELKSGINLDLYTLSSISNPTNSTEQQQYFMDQMSVPLTLGKYQEYSYDLTQNIIVTDKSIFPWNNYVQTSHSLRTQNFLKQWMNDNQTTSETLVYFQRSSKTIVHTRQYYKLLDAASYAGGIFQTLIGLFVFVSVFSRLFFEFTFAQQYFHSQILKRFNFKDMLKQLTYKSLKAMKCPPEWEEAREREQIRLTVNNLLDMVYLHRRIDVLERTLPILFEEHQLKGLYLIHKKTQEEANQNYGRHRLRDRLISYLNMMNRDSQQNVRQSSGGIVEKRNEQNSSSEKGFKQIQLYPVDNPQFKDIIRHNVEPKFKKKQTNILSFLENDENFELRRQKTREEEQGLDNLRETAAALPKIKEEEIKEDELNQWLQNDLLRLFREAENPNGDKRSKKIYELLDDWLKVTIRMTIKKDAMNVGEQEFRHRNKIYLRNQI